MVEEPSLYKQKIAVIGLGWLGMPLALRLKDVGYKVCGTTRTESKKNECSALGIQTILLDLNQPTDENEVTAFLKDSSVCVITIPPSKSIVQTYKSQCLQLISFLPENCHFIFTSSSSVYSENPGEAKEETNLIRNYNFTSPLFLTEKELIVKLKNRLTILRLTGLFGEGRNPAHFLAGKTGLKNGGSPVNLVHQQDCIEIIYEIIRQNCWGEILNVCCSDHPTREAFYTWMCRKEGLNIPYFEASINAPNKIVINQKSKELLNFTYKYDSPFHF